MDVINETQTTLEQEIVGALRQMPLDKKLAVLDFVEWLLTEPSRDTQVRSRIVTAAEPTLVKQDQQHH